MPQRNRAESEARRARILELGRQRKERDQRPLFLERLGQQDSSIVEPSEWVTCTDLDEDLEAYSKERQRLDAEGKVFRSTETTSLAEFESMVTRLVGVISDPVLAVPHGIEEVGGTVLTPKRFAELALPLLLADRDDLAVLSTTTTDAALLTIYDSYGQLSYQLDVWGPRWPQPFIGPQN